MSWSGTERWLSSLLEPSVFAIVITGLVALTVPPLLHLIIYRSSGAASLPSFLLIGPSGSGKTTLLTLVGALTPNPYDRIAKTNVIQFERGSPAATHTSQTPLSIEVSLPVTTSAASARYRSINDPANQTHKRFLLIDTPGHGKLRHHALDNLTKPQNIKGIIFVVDAANTSVGAGGPAEGGITEAAEFLHDVLLLLQKRSTRSNTSKAPAQMPVLIAANKLDLFTALPAPLVKTALESEINKIRTSKSRGLLDSGVGMGDADLNEEKDWLGEMGEGKFDFSQMEEFDVPIAVAGGNVAGTEEPDVRRWWDWIGSNM
ncbi:MAG: hypothetical protein M1835_005572 [Candelina submexicana]|nr:MAG: hypothetical protein M1835_005572 [Candelina submexicana]